MKKGGGLLRFAAPAMLLVFFLVISTAVATKSATYDESVHIFSGWRILTAGDFTTNHEHPPLMKVLAAAPLVIAGVRPPTGTMQKEVDQWAISHEFVYHVNDGDRVLALSRFPIALLATLLAWAFHRFAVSTLGETAGLAALAFLISEPNILAHSGLVTTDLGITAFTFFTFAAFAAWLRTRARHWMIAAGILLGLALATKFTAILLLPILAVGGLVRVWLERKGRLPELGKGFVIMGLLALFVLNLAYGFSGTFSSLRSFTPESRSFQERAASALGAVPLPLPREYVRGFDHAEAGGQVWWAYLFGEHSRTGWRHYYLAALAVKTPLPLLLMAMAGIFLWRSTTRGADPLNKADLLFIQTPILVYLLAFTLSGNLKNIGLRYILPVYPFLCLMAGVAVAAIVRRSWGRRVVQIAIAWQVCAAIWIYPDYLTFFNMTVGGPSHGAEILLDSNLDWGQDLKGLGRHIKEHRIEKVYVDYFGRGCRKYYGVRSTPDFEGGWIAVSATQLKGVYSDDKERYRFLEGVEPSVRIGGSIYLYDVPRPSGWIPKSAAGD